MLWLIEILLITLIINFDRFDRFDRYLTLSMCVKQVVAFSKNDLSTFPQNILMGSDE